MTGQPTKKGKVTSLGWAPPDDPIYQGGWNFLIGKNVYVPHIEDPDPPAKPMSREQMQAAAGAAVLEKFKKASRDDGTHSTDTRQLHRPARARIFCSSRQR